MDDAGIEEPFSHAVLDRGGIDVGAVRADFARRQQGPLFHGFAEKAFGRFEIAVGGQQKVDRRPVLVDGAVESAPLAANFDVSLVNADRTAMRPSELAKAFLDHRRIGERPAIDGGVVDVEAALGEQAFEITVAERIAQIPCHRLNDQRRLEMATLEIVPGATFEFLGEGVQDHGVGLRHHHPRPAAPNFALTPEILRQAP